MTTAKIEYYRIGSRRQVRGPTLDKYSEKAAFALAILEGIVDGFSFYSMKLVEDGFAVANRPGIRVILEKNKVTVCRDPGDYYASARCKRTWNLEDPNSIEEVREYIYTLIKYRQR